MSGLDRSIVLSRVEAVIFDLDGVLVDSRGPISSALNRALVEHGRPTRPVSELHAFIGPPIHDVGRHLLATSDETLVDEFVASYRRQYADTIRDTVAFPGIIDALATLHGRAPIGIATSKLTSFAVPLLNHLKLDRYFAVVAGSEPGERDVDKAVIVARAIEQLGRETRSVMVGDRKFDVCAAHSHGLKAIGVTWGVGSAQELRWAGADVLVDAPSELIAVLLPGIAP